MNKMLIATVLSLSIGVSSQAAAQSTTGPSQALSQASMASVAASGLVIQGSFAGMEASGQFVVASIQVVGEAAIVVLRGVSSATEVSVKMAAHLARDLSLAVGSAVVVVAEAVGYALIASGKLIAYVPNEIGRSLIYQSRIR